MADISEFETPQSSQEEVSIDVEEVVVESLSTSRKSLVKIGYKPNLIKLVSTAQIFTVVGHNKRMENIGDVKAGRELFLNTSDENGDYHYFKKQSFHGSHSRTTKDGDLIPQAQFDDDPKGYIEKFLSDKFEYMGLETIIPRKGEKRSLHHKIKVKGKFIRELVGEELAKDKTGLHMPKTGKVLSYARFYALICKVNETKKKNVEELRKKKFVARMNSIEQLLAMEQVALKVEEELFADEKKIINEKREALEKTVNQENTLAGVDSFNTLKAMVETERSDLDKKLIEKRNSLVKYYEEVRELRKIYDIERAALMLERNNKRRLKRYEEKETRRRIDNGLAVSEGSSESNNPERQELVLEVDSDESSSDHDCEYL